ncbi:hypothetical protein FHW96_000174 [Novosphingobium sp. SG751A]|nr:hypothetical protein [Novosphingobium sp. SG751A]
MATSAARPMPSIPAPMKPRNAAICPADLTLPNAGHAGRITINPMLRQKIRQSVSQINIAPNPAQTGPDLQNALQSRAVSRSWRTGRRVSPRTNIGMFEAPCCRGAGHDGRGPAAAAWASAAAGLLLTGGITGGRSLHNQVALRSFRLTPRRAWRSYPSRRPPRHARRDRQDCGYT